MDSQDPRYLPSWYICIFFIMSSHGKVFVHDLGEGGRGRSILGSPPSSPFLRAALANSLLRVSEDIRFIWWFWSGHSAPRLNLKSKMRNYSVPPKFSASLMHSENLADSCTLKNSFDLLTSLFSRAHPDFVFMAAGECELRWSTPLPAGRAPDSSASGWRQRPHALSSVLCLWTE